MNILDLIVIAAIAAAAAAAAAHVLRRNDGCGTCESCPGSIYCKKKKS